MKKRIWIFLSLALIAGLFCFLVFSNNNKSKIGESQVESESQQGEEISNDLKNDDNNPSEIGDEDDSEKDNAEELSHDNELNEGFDKDSKADEINESEQEESADHSKKDSHTDNSTSKNENVETQTNTEDSLYSINTNSIQETSKYYQKELKTLANTVLDSFVINKDEASFDYPNVTDPLHLSVKLQVFKWNGQGDDTIFRYQSDDGWLGGNPVNNSNHKEKLALNLDEDLSKYKIVLEIKTTNFDSKMIQIYDAFWNEEDPMELICAETKLE